LLLPWLLVVLGLYYHSLNASLVYAGDATDRFAPRGEFTVSTFTGVTAISYAPVTVPTTTPGETIDIALALFVYPNGVEAYECGGGDATVTLQPYTFRITSVHFPLFKCLPSPRVITTGFSQSWLLIDNQLQVNVGARSFQAGFHRLIISFVSTEELVAYI
jgi:hypothetical protein